MTTHEPTFPENTSETAVRPLAIAVLICVGFMVLSGLLGRVISTEVDLAWYQGLIRPQPEPPQWMVLVVTVLYYPLFLTLIYRVFARIDTAYARRVSMTLIVLAMLAQTLWNPVLIGTRSIFVGVIGNALLALLVLALVLFIRGRDRFSAVLLLPYVAWVTLELAWSAGLFAMNR